MTCGDSPLTALVIDKENKRGFISNQIGEVYIVDISLVHLKKCILYDNLANSRDNSYNSSTSKRNN